MSPGYNRLPGNEPLETTYLAYQAEVLDTTYAGNPGFLRIDQLPKHEQAQVGAMAARLVAESVASPEILRKRLERIRILQDEEHDASLSRRKRSGEFGDGLAVVKHDSNPAFENHVRMHEIGHGLEAIGVITDSGSSVTEVGYGLHSSVVGMGNLDTFTIQVLDQLHESLVDDLALGVSELDSQAYLRGRAPGTVYVKCVNALNGLTSQDPALAAAIKRANFSDGLNSPRQGQKFAAAFMSAVLDIELDGY